MTVSKALRNEPGIGSPTRKTVIDLARKLGYQPNRAARALVTGRSHALGFVVPGQGQTFFSQIGQAMSRVLGRNDYGMVIASSDEDEALERKAIDLMLAHRVDALIVAPVETKND